MNTGIYRRLLIAILAIVQIAVFLKASAPAVDAAAPTLSDVAFEPADPTLNAPLNVTASFELSGEPITLVEVEPCFGGTCKLPQPMTDTGTGVDFYKVFPAGYFGTEDVFAYFHFLVSYGVSSSVYLPENPESTEINVTVRRVPTILYLEAEPDRTVIHPNQTITLNGTLTNDLMENVSGAMVNLSIGSLSIHNTSTTNSTGHFSLGLTVPVNGTFILNLTANDGRLWAYEEWEVTVNSWPLPRMTITAEASSQTEDRPPGSDVDMIYADSNITVLYWVGNEGNGDARNLTVLFTIDDVAWDRAIDVGNLTPSQRFEGTLEVGNLSVGVHILNITCDWFQDAPDQLKQAPPVWSFGFTVLERPAFTGHRVLIEMFTQTTCVPCVPMEEAIERLHEVEGLDFEYIMYVYDDPVSQLKAVEMNVTGTPDVFIDHGFDRITGGGEVEALMQQVSSVMENSSKMEVPPATITFMGDGVTINASLHLSGSYDRTFSGMLQVFKVESVSEMRNNQGIPISRRFLGSVTGGSVEDLSPGSYYNLSMEAPSHGEGYVAILSGLDGMVVQSDGYHPFDGPGLMMRTEEPIVRFKAPGPTPINITLERFMFDEGSFPEVDYELVTEDLNGDWNLTLSGFPLSDSENLSGAFGMTDAEMETKPVGRVRYWQDLSLQLEVPRNASGTHAFTLHLYDGGYDHQATFVLFVTKADDGGPVKDPRIVDFSLEGEGMAIYFYAEAENVPEGGLVKGSVIPCFYGNDARCGVPVEVILLAQGDGKFRAPVQGVDLGSYTNLSYYAWIEVGGKRINETVTQTRNVPISSLIEDLPDDDDDDGSGAVIFGVSVIALLLIIGIAALLFILAKRTSPMEEGPATSEVEEDQATIEDEAKQTEVGPVDGGAMPPENPPTVPEEPAPKEVVGPEEGQTPAEGPVEGAEAPDLPGKPEEPQAVAPELKPPS